MSTLANKLHVYGVRRQDSSLILDMGEGKIIEIPLKAFPRLQHATEAELQDFRHSGAGTGICWPQVDEDLSFAWLVQDYGIKVGKG